MNNFLSGGDTSTRYSLAHPFYVLLLLSPVSASTVDVKLNVVCHSVVTLLIESFSSQIIGQCPCFEVVSSLRFSKQVEHEALCNGARKKCWGERASWESGKQNLLKCTLSSVVDKS